MVQNPQQLPSVYDEKGGQVLQDSFLEVYDKFKLEFFRRIFELVRERECLAHCYGGIFDRDHLRPERADHRPLFALNISQSNATYKVNSLIKKRYLKTAELRHRPQRISPHFCRKKYYSYTDIMRSYVKNRSRPHRGITSRPRKQGCFQIMLMRISAEMMPGRAVLNRTEC